MQLLMLCHRSHVAFRVRSSTLLRVACSHGRQANAAIGVPRSTRSTRSTRRSRRTKRLTPTSWLGPRVPVNLDRTPGHAMREFVGFFLRDLRDLRGGSNWGVCSTPRLANDNRLGPSGIRGGPAEDSGLAELPSHGASRTLRLLRWRPAGNPAGPQKKAPQRWKRAGHASCSEVIATGKESEFAAKPYFFKAASTALIRSASSGATRVPKRLATLPSRPMMNFSKFQPIGPAPFGFVSTAVSSL